jgi:hypothetical protein
MPMLSPRCPVHVGKPMNLSDEILAKTYSGRRRVTGYRYRCPVPSCPRCEVVMLKTQEVSDLAKTRHWPKTIKRLGYPRQ